MEIQTSQYNSIPSAAALVEENIFSDFVDTRQYEKSLKNARIWLYVIAVIQAGIGVYEYTTTDYKDLALVAGGLDLGIGVLFLLLAIWSYSKPVAAFMTALATFQVIHIGLSILDPSHIYKALF